MSRRLVAYEWMSLDGVVQAPGTADEDPSGGFAHGGWHLRWFDDASQQWVVDGLNRAGAFLFGRLTYERFAAHWPHVSGPERVIAEPLNSKPKYVASTTLAAPLAWAHSTLLDGDAVQAVAALKQEGDGEVHLIGSAHLARTLLEHDLIDELRLMIDPVLVGGGKRIWPETGLLKTFALVHSQPVSTGALLVSYSRGGR